MKFIVIAFYLLVSLKSFSQTILTLDYECNNPKIGFSKVTVIDKRSKDQLLGYVQIGQLDAISKVNFAGNLQDSVGKFFEKESIDTLESKLVIILYDLFLGERTEGLLETGRLKIGLRAFVEKNNLFFEVLNHDSIYKFKKLDVTDMLLKSVSQKFCEIANLTAGLSDKVDGKNGFTESSLNNIEDAEKALLLFIMFPPPRTAFTTVSNNLSPTILPIPIL